MSVTDSLAQFRESMATRWQVPLLGVAVVFLILAFLKVQPPGPVPSFQQQLDQIAALQQGGFLVDASEMIQRLLDAEGVPKERRGVLLRALAETIYLAERGRSRHDPENVKRLIRNHREALALGMPPTAAVHEQMGHAFRWIERREQALNAYREALAAGSEREGRLRREIIELLRETGDASDEAVSTQLSAMLGDEQLDPNDLLWAVQQQVDLYAGDGKQDQIGPLLDRVSPRLARAGLDRDVEYLQARMHYVAGQADQAERILLSLRNRLEPHEDLSAKVTWMLGRVHLDDGRPQEAMACFEEVIQQHPQGEYALASRLGVAECLAALGHIDESASVFEEVAGLAARHKPGDVVDRDAVRASLTSHYAVLRNEGRLEAAVRFLRLAAALVTPDDEKTQANYLRRLADLYVSLGETRLERVGAASRPSTVPATGGGDSDGAREAFRLAAENYLRLSRVVMTDVDRSGNAAWLAAVQFDRANMPERMIAVLEDFLAGYPASTKLPDALYRLGQAFQSLGEYRKAIAAYAQNQERFPRTPAAMRSMVPMAQCYMALGVSSYPQVEKVLLAVVEQPTQKGRYDPQALEYREALFALGDLYDRWNKPGRAVSRLEEFLDRYPRDVRVPRAQFVLADAYRKSGLSASTQPGGADQRQAEVSKVPDRLRRAEELFAEVIHTLGSRPEGTLTPTEELYLKYGYLYRADCAFDLGQYERARSLYEEACRRFRRDPVSLPAYVQILNCYQRLGNDAEARATVRRVKWLLKSIPEQRFAGALGGQDRAYWQSFFDWVETSGLF